MPSDQHVLNTDGSVKKIAKEPFRDQDKILTSIVKNLCGKGGLPISLVEQEWFREFMKLVEPRFESVSRVALIRRHVACWLRYLSQQRNIEAHNCLTVPQSELLYSQMYGVELPQ